MHPARLYRHARDLADYLLAFKRKEFTGLAAGAVNNHTDLLRAKKLHAKVYCERGFVEKSDVTAAGILSSKKDPYQGHAIYFLVRDKKTDEVVATARQIWVLPGQGYQSFPLFKYSQLYKNAWRLVGKHQPEHSVEISGLAKRRGASKMAPLLLYRAMWHASLRQGHTLWLLTCDVRLFARLKLLFGPAILQVGRVNFYLGSNVVPAILRVDAAVSELRHSLRSSAGLSRLLRVRVVRFLLKGLPVDTLSAREKRALASLGEEFNIFP